MPRVLEGPAPGVVLLEQLHQPLVIAKRRCVVGGEEPVRIARDVELRIVNLADEAGRHRELAFATAVGILVVHRRDMRYVFERHVEPRLLLVEARIASQRALGRRRHRGEGFPAHERPARRIGREQVDRQRGPGARQPEHECRPLDRRFEQRRVGLEVVLDLEPVGERGGDARGQPLRARGGQRRFGVERVDEHVEPLEHRGVAEIRQPGLAPCIGQQFRSLDHRVRPACAEVRLRPLPSPARRRSG